MSKTFTREELKQYDGRDGRPAYIAHKGAVYDVTHGPTWDMGDHFGQHAAGEDLTDAMELAPHEEDVLAAFPVVGHLVD